MNETTTATSGRAASGGVVARRRSCFFCGQTNGPFTNEHVWPKWVSGLLCGGRRNSFDHHFRYLKATDDVPTKKWTKHSLEVTTKICESCNIQWLSDFEDRIKPLASPLIVGGVAALALAPESRALLAAWAYKLALLLEVSHPDKSTDFFTPLADRLQFRRTTSAHGLVHVFVGRYDFGHRLAHASILRQTFAQRTFYLQLATMTAGHLAMQVMSVRSVASNDLVLADETDFEFHGLARETVSPIWPPVPGYLKWPPARTMSHQDVEDLASMRAVARTATSGH